MGSLILGRLPDQNSKAIEYIGDTPEGWKVYRVQGEDRPSGYVTVPPEKK